MENYRGEQTTATGNGKSLLEMIFRYLNILGLMTYRKISDKIIEEM